MIKDIFSIIISLLTIVGWLVIIRLVWILPNKIDELNERLREMYSGIALLLWRFGFLKPLKKGKIINEKTDKIKLVFSTRFLKALDIHWENKDKVKEKKSKCK